jgi:DNA-binding NtrC family response regulator
LHPNHSAHRIASEPQKTAPLAASPKSACITKTPRFYVTANIKERPDDIPLLAQFFVRRVCEKSNIKVKAVDDDVLSELKRYPWPGNIRELQNVIERMVTMSGEPISLLDIPEEIASAEDYAGNRHAGSPLREFRDQAEREFILATLKRNLGNISQSAIELGVGRSYLHRRLAVLGIAKKDWFS